MRVETIGLQFKIDDAAPKIVDAGEYETSDPIETQLLLSLADAGAVTITE